MNEHDLFACPICSHPPALISRPLLVRGVRAKRWMIVTALHCDHMPLRRADNSEENAEPLVIRWNKWVATEAAKRCAAAGMDFDRAARFLDDLRPFSYRPALVRR